MDQLVVELLVYIRILHTIFEGESSHECILIKKLQHCATGAGPLIQKAEAVRESHYPFNDGPEVPRLPAENSMPDAKPLLPDSHTPTFSNGMFHCYLAFR